MASRAQVNPMNNHTETKHPQAADDFLDITADTCPITYVRTKLKLETMTEGDILEVRLIGAEPLENVPKTATANGHTVLSIEAEQQGGGDVPQRLLIRRGPKG